LPGNFFLEILGKLSCHPDLLGYAAERSVLSWFLKRLVNMMHSFKKEILLRNTRFFYALSLLLVFFFSGTLGALGEEASSEAEKEIRLGRKVGEEIEKSLSRGRDLRIEARLQMILDRLVLELDTKYDYEVRLLEEKTPNAFALPGGLLYVNRGMMDFLRTDHEIAGIIAHEIIHVEQSHGIKQAARNQRLNLLSLAVIAATGGQGAAIILSSVAQAAISSGYSREYEEQADREGLMLLQKAGYEPTGLVTAMERLHEEGWKRPYVDPGVYMDHPETEDRVAYLIQTMQDRGWPLRRKKTLALLRPSWAEEGGEGILSIDGVPLWRIPRENIEDVQIQEILSGIQESLEMEMLPHEIVLEETSSVSVLRVGNRIFCVARTPELRQAFPNLRQALVRGLDGARRQHPMGGYLR
jgi:Zn-dependent protease with chaperone function